MGKLRLIDDPHGPAVRLDPDGAIGNTSNLHRRLLLHRTNCLRSSIRVFRLFKGTPAVRPETSDLFTDGATGCGSLIDPASPSRMLGTTALAQRSSKDISR